MLNDLPSLHVLHKPYWRVAMQPGIVKGWREDHRHPVMDIADGRSGRAGEDYEAKLSIALLPGEAGQVQHRLQGSDRVLNFCRAGLPPF